MPTLSQLPLKHLLIALLVVTALVAGSLGTAHAAGWTVFVLQGHSMEPTISPGSLIVARTVPADDLAVGDVTLFSVGWLEPGVDVTAAHRITRVVPQAEGLLVYTKGDGNAVADPAPTLFQGSAPRAAFVIGNGQQMLKYARLLGFGILAAFVYLACASIVGGFVTGIASRSRSLASLRV